ncbi:efflux RND transporter permease subunit [Bacillus sp. RG28]|uniref:Efflux RND transporter permease subunit n=1 Tax=Gottfriedia endophytica TaxID=2820819 RepID=A0A940NT24_9BACI|nr:efflux RND transporter permease subunit [Gottfriedia endophytica]MBP0726532.1 efflux RND transporter permease subunit [Gottfriedia endophytica]
MGSWIKFSLRNAAVVFLAMMMIVIGGIYSVKTIKMEQMPNVDIPYIIVQIPYSGATPNQVQNDLGQPLEETLSGLQKLKNLYIESHSNVAVAILEFEMNKNMADAEKDVTTAVASINLPEGAGKPVILKDGPSAAPVFSFALSSDKSNQSDLTQFVNDRIKPTLTTINGAGIIDIYGEEDKQLLVQLDAEKMKQKTITYEMVKQSILSHNFSIPSGQIDLNGKTLNVQADFQLKSPEDLKQINILVPNPKGLQKVKLSEIAKINYGNKKDDVYTRLNGKPAVLVQMKAQAGSNAVEVVRQAKEKLKDITIPKDYKLTQLYDTSKEVKKSVDSMLREVLLGTLFAVIVTFIFLRNIRATIVAVLSIPLSILAALITMKYLDYSLNIMTLAGIAVAVGRVIDDSIVVIENVYRQTQLSKERNEMTVLTAAKEVGGAVMSSTLTTMAVFGPLSFVPGIIGKFFAPFGITVIVALAFSLIVSLTVVPLLAKIFLLKITHNEPKKTFLQKAYARTLSWVLHHRTITLIMALVIFIGSLGLIPLIPKNFLPEEKSLSYTLTGDLPIGTSLNKANVAAKNIENILSNDKNIKDYQTYLNGEHLNILIDLKEDATKSVSQKFEKDTLKKVKALDDTIQFALTPIGIAGGGNQFRLIVDGGNRSDLERAGNLIVEKIKNIKGLSNVKTNLSGVKPQLNLEINDDIAANKGLNPMVIANFVLSLIAGENVTNIRIGDKTTSVVLGLKSGELNSTNRIMDQTLINSYGQPIKLSDVATLTEKPGPTALYRLNQQEYVDVSGRFTTDNISGVQAEVNKEISKLRFPKGIKTHSEGQSQAMNEGFINMSIAMVIAVVLVFVVMLITFGNVIVPISILSSLPFLFTGGFLGLYFSKQALGMPALVGFLMLIGIVVTNAIVLMDRVKENEKKGMELTKSLLEAGTLRLRPILMTALATIGALTPLALSTEGGLISRSLAIVVISGLLTSTILTLVIVPSVYHVLKSIKQRISKQNKNSVLKEKAV